MDVREVKVWGVPPLQNVASLNLVFAGAFVSICTHKRSLLRVLLVLPVYPIHESPLGR